MLSLILRVVLQAASKLQLVWLEVSRSTDVSRGQPMQRILVYELIARFWE